MEHLCVKPASVSEMSRGKTDRENPAYITAVSMGDENRPDVQLDVSGARNITEEQCTIFSLMII